ncbi:MAG TPA: anthranilate phosphoribosyltransferase [Methanothrix sp.]|jgi:anthranilate phosphoribosyltransferase|nr:anthranilate phosphoribosyltransferase [Methanothrix sp.]HOV82852.1 anthranilate phosphoribosyltransferase [Methanothrix sp.]HPC89596.1 anthranilate phosphoribosyltransferase [Methanothrix sp.]HQE87630.1 anthranilate phosphoribosyltransferase [Methanothrix sp.]HQI68587.1 anthranilate phosphoribosyltransferase [Methanothrix sp.]
MSYLQKIVDGRDLTVEEAESLMGEIFSSATDAQIGSILIALRIKGESVSEIAGFAKQMRQSAIRIHPRVKGILVDTCGTGGDASNTINVSTAAAIVSAACGVPVAKHGNYAISSKCGSANVLSELGVNISPSPQEVSDMIERLGIGFMLAPAFHPAMKRVGPLRREIGLRTVFNILGPLTNPAGAAAQVMGVYDPALCEKLANVLKILGTERAMVVHGMGMDEITNTGETHVAELKDGTVTSYCLQPEDLGYPRSRPADIAGGSPEENARKLASVMKGERSPARDIIAMNSGAAIYICGRAASLQDGARMAEEALDSGRALRVLKQMTEAGGEPEKLERFL